jgi:exodeoxyribonuclease VII large subunit
LRASDPLRALARGYSLTYKSTGELVRSAADLTVGQTIITRVADGRVEATVAQIEKGSRDDGKE